MDQPMKDAVYQVLLEELQDAVNRRDGDQASVIVRMMTIIDPETTDRLIDALIEIGLRRLAGLVN